MGVPGVPGEHDDGKQPGNDPQPPGFPWCPRCPVAASARPLHPRYRPRITSRRRREPGSENPVNLVLRPDVLLSLGQLGAEPGAFRVGLS